MDRKAVVADFLRKCVDYANASIARKQARGQDELIPAWQTYIEFTQHAIDEIHTGKLDSWFERESRPDLSTRTRLDIMEFTHKERSAWLAGAPACSPITTRPSIRW